MNVCVPHSGEVCITSTFQDTAPKVFFALQRFLSPEQLDTIRRDYAHAHQVGGNDEPVMNREEGVSFNPRLARILSILAKDLGVRELAVLRAALYAACNDTSSDRADIPTELRPLVVPHAEGHFDDARAYTIQAVLALDTARHLHQSSRTASEKDRVLKDAESLLIAAASAGIPDMLSRTGLKSNFVAREARCEAKRDEVAARISSPVAEDSSFELCSKKLQHACAQQRRLLALE